MLLLVPAGCFVPTHKIFGHNWQPDGLSHGTVLHAAAGERNQGVGYTADVQSLKRALYTEDWTTAVSVDAGT